MSIQEEEQSNTDEGVRYWTENSEDAAESTFGNHGAEENMSEESWIYSMLVGLKFTINSWGFWKEEKMLLTTKNF